MENYEVVIVGAGVTGLCAARTFLSIDPSISLLVVDDKQSIGGVWADEQLYPGLRTNHSQGYYEFADLPLLDLNLGVEPRGIVPGKVQNAYLNEYVRRFDLAKHIRLRTRVLRAVEQDAHPEGGGDGGWALHLSHDGQPAPHPVRCRKLLIATGQYSTPSDMKLPGADVFGHPIIHSVDLGRSAAPQLSDPAIRHVTVLGGSRSAHEAVYMYSTAGKTVTWLMRTRAQGRGAMPIAPSYSPIGPFKVWAEGLLMSRPVSWFCAAPWSDGDGFGWIRGFLHGTWLGNRVVEGLFAKLQSDATHTLRLDRDPNTKVLVPDVSTMWYGTQISSVNYDADFYDLIREGRVEVTRGDIARLAPGGKVVLVDGRTLACDALVCGTGWDFSASVPLEPAERRVRWGVPIAAAKDDLHPNIDERADRELFVRFPLLKRSPARPEREPKGLTPWRLWRFIAPPSQVERGKDRNVAFLNASVSYQATTKAEITSLWAYAYLYDKLEVPSPSEEEARYEACLWTRFGKWQVPYGMQGRVGDFLFSSMPYYDLLLRDLGLNSWRKGWGWVGEVFGSWYNIKDYKGIVDEWKTLQRGKSSKRD